MKYSTHIGVLAALALIATCFFPWLYITSIQTTITGLSAEHTNYGQPGLANIILSSICILFFLINKIWAKRANVITSTLNFAWALRNIFLLTRCEMGECPIKLPGIYILVFLSFIMFLMALLPKISLNKN